MFVYILCICSCGEDGLINQYDVTVEDEDDVLTSTYSMDQPVLSG
jgi:hypothetical protein